MLSDSIYIRALIKLYREGHIGVCQGSGLGRGQDTLTLELSLSKLGLGTWPAPCTTMYIG